MGCAIDALVTDEGHHRVGREQIEAWLTVDVLQRLEGDFPAGVADLHYRFAVDDELISRS